MMNAIHKRPARLQHIFLPRGLSGYSLRRFRDSPHFSLLNPENHASFGL